MAADNQTHILAVTALIKNQKGDKFLILKRNKEEIAFPCKWCLPGGKLERGEKIFDTLKREVLEEVGLELEDFKEFLKDYTFSKSDGNNVVGLCFLVKAKNDSVKLSQEFDEFTWIKPEDLKKFDYIRGMEEEVKKAFKK